MKEQTPDICLEAVKRNGYALHYVNPAIFPDAEEVHEGDGGGVMKSILSIQHAHDPLFTSAAIPDIGSRPPVEGMCNRLDELLRAFQRQVRCSTDQEWQSITMRPHEEAVRTAKEKLREGGDAVGLRRGHQHKLIWHLG